MSAAVPHDPRRGRWIPWVFAGGMLLVVAVNAVLVFASVGTFAGVGVGRPYERGRGYEAVLAEAERQDALGWSADVALDRNVLVVSVRDRDGRAVEGRLTGILQRPAERDERALEPVAEAPGRWLVPVAGARRGQWDARLAFTGPGGAVFEARQRIMVP